MDSFEFYNQYKSAKGRFESAKKQFYAEWHTIEKAYISSNYAFKEGDIVIFKNFYITDPTLMVIDSMHIINYSDPIKEHSFRDPVVEISGHQVDEDGYYKTFLYGALSPIAAQADDVIEVTNIRPKGLRQR